jgi:TonB family protein
MSSRQPGADLNEQIDEARTKQITIGEGGRTSRVDDRARPGTVDERPIADSPQVVTREDHRDEEARGRIIPGDVRPDDTTTLTPEIVLQRINTLYRAGLERCYRLGLAQDSTLSGRVKINFTVDERGKVIDPDASGVSSQVDRCVRKAMSGWRFPIPRKGGEPVDATFTVSLALQPS